MTSPDNLLPHGETFIRNFLVAARWNAATLRLPIQNLWIPDDFGHDSQLPVAVAAMGLVGAAFARVPGSDWANAKPGAAPTGTLSLYDQLKQNGLDFVWQANDGSELLAHYLMGGYGEGDEVGAGQPNMNIDKYFQDNQASSKTPYVFVTVGSDFHAPVGSFPQGKNLLDLVNAWNDATTQPSYDNGAGPWAAALTFDHYVQLLSYHRAGLPHRAFDGVPYWLGVYASRPANKLLHYSASRTLLAAEVLGLVADTASLAKEPGRPTPNPARLAAQQRAWDALVASTHHDYITGTSATSTASTRAGVPIGIPEMDVNAVEQLPRLQLAAAEAAALCAAAVEEIAGGIAVPAGKTTAPVVVCNPLGFFRTGLVSLPGGAAIGARSVAASVGGTAGAVQAADDGSLLFLASAHSLGYDTVYLSTSVDAPAAAGAAVRATGPGVFEISNGLVTAILDAPEGGITSFVDVQAEGPRRNLLGGMGNQLVFYSDTGNIYRYGNEPMPNWAGDPQPDGCTMTPMQPQPTLTWQAQVVESGPVRATVRFEATTLIGAEAYRYVVTYSLVAGEPMLRIGLTGRLPANTSLFCSFPFAGGKVDSLTHGTPCHWSDMTMVPYWPLPLFYATHNFLLPIVNGAVAAAVYHEGMPSWGYDKDGNLLGNVLRNTLGTDHYGAVAADLGTHTQHYALRVPGSLRRLPGANLGAGAAVAGTGQPLREALQFNTPMHARQVAPQPLSNGKYPLSYTLATVTASSAFFTAAKAADLQPGSVVLRLYQPASGGGDVEVAVTTGVNASGATVTTALEGPFLLPDQQPPTATLKGWSDVGFEVVMHRALATVQLTGPSA